MGKKLILLLGILATLLIFSGAYVVIGTQAYLKVQQANSANKQYCSNQNGVNICVNAPQSIYSAFYPSYLTMHDPPFIITYSSNNAMALLVSVSIPGFSQQVTQLVHANALVQKLAVAPPMQDQGQVLRSLTTEFATTLHVTVTDTNKHTYYVNDIPLLLHSRWLMQWTKANSMQIAAWVTPDDPAVGNLVTAAISHLGNEPPPAPAAMVGYNGATQQQVIDEVDAIYDALLGHMHYVQATVPYVVNENDSNTDGTEEVKLPGEVLKQQSGMCVELTAVLASAVERIGLHSEIVIIPGHAFLGVALNPQSSSFAYWDAVDLNANITGDSANVAADKVYADNLRQHTILATIVIRAARADGIGPML